MSSSSTPPGVGGGFTTTAEEREEAAAMRSGDGDTSSSSSSVAAIITNIPRVAIDHNAVQKYALIAVYDAATSSTGGDLATAHFFVRGSRHASYHKDAAQPLVNELRQLQVPFEVIGGGRIHHQAGKEEVIKVYGYSYGFPWKNGESRHYVTAQLLKAHFTGQTVEYTDDGY